MYEIEAIEMMRLNLNKVFDNIIAEIAKNDQVTFLEFRMKTRNIEALRDEMNCSFDGIVAYIYRQIIDPTDESIF